MKTEEEKLAAQIALTQTLIWALGCEWLKVLNTDGPGIRCTTSSVVFYLKSWGTSDWHDGELVAIAKAFGGVGYSSYQDTIIQVTFAIDAIADRADFVRCLVAILETDRPAPLVERPTILS